MNRNEVQEAPDVAAELRSELEASRRQLAAARAKNVMWRSVIEQHLNKGCLSRSLRALLDADPHPNDL